jgi:hypothetical protein
MACSILYRILLMSVLSRFSQFSSAREIGLRIGWIVSEPRRLIHNVAR